MAEVIPNSCLSGHEKYLEFCRSAGLDEIRTREAISRFATIDVKYESGRSEIRNFKIGTISNFDDPFDIPDIVFMTRMLGVFNLPCNRKRRLPSGLISSFTEIGDRLVILSHYCYFRPIVAMVAGEYLRQLKCLEESNGIKRVLMLTV